MKINKQILKVSTLLLGLTFSVSSFALEEKLRYPKNETEENKYQVASYQGCHDVYDPYEKFNRKIFVFNSTLDYFILRPIALSYDKILNDYSKARVTNFVDNLNAPVTFVNYGLQAKGDNVLKSFWRFAINTTIGVGGLFDVASKMGLRVEPQSLGHTLAHYGVPPGPYIMLPLLGGANARDITEVIYANEAMNPVKFFLHRDFKYSLTALKLVNDRSIIMPFTDHITKTALDPYVAIRSSIHQKRESSVKYPNNFICPTIKNEN